MTYQRSFILGLAAALVAILLAACGGDSGNGGESSSDALPLDPNLPTFIFFYIDG